MEKRILHLTLIRKWFDQIAAGEKKEEYRDKKPYWDTRLKGKSYDEIWFRNGYSKDAPFMRVEWNGIREDEKRYAIILGKVLEVRHDV